MGGPGVQSQISELARAWIIRDRNEAIGYLVITLGFSVEYGGLDGFIDDLYLIKAARGRGLGREVIAFALERAAELATGCEFSAD